MQHIRPVQGNCKLLSSKKISCTTCKCRLPRFTTAAHEAVPARGIGHSHCQMQAEAVRASSISSSARSACTVVVVVFFFFLRDLTCCAKAAHGSIGTSRCQTSLLMPELTCETGKRRFDMATWAAAAAAASKTGSACSRLPSPRTPSPSGVFGRVSKYLFNANIFSLICRLFC